MAPPGTGWLRRLVTSYRLTLLLLVAGVVAYLVVSANAGAWGTYDAVWDFWVGVSLAGGHVLLLNGKRFEAWEVRWDKRVTRRGQDRRIAREAAKSGCTFCRADYAWAYPMRRELDVGAGDWLLPAWLPTCEACHEDIENDRTDELVAKLAEANPGRKGGPMRELLPVFLAAREGQPVRRSA